ncbi:MAG: AMP phosphorylase [Nitrososphaeria archaeon]
MELRSKIIDVKGTKRSVIINEEDAQRIGVELNDRVRVSSDSKSFTCIVETTRTLVPKGVIGIYRDLSEELGVKDGETVSVQYEQTPLSVDLIRKKVKGEKLSDSEIKEIVRDLVNNELSDLEVAEFVFAVNFMGLDMDEIRSLTQAMVESGERLQLQGFTVDKHSIGGVPGNKVTLLIVPTVALTELYIPKTSSSAITSPSGTADTMSVLANVKFSLSEIKSIVEKTHGCIVWGGTLNLAPADDYLIKIENPLRLNPRGLMMASVMAKKLAVGAKVVVLDLPVGRGTKLNDLSEAEKLAKDFYELGRSLGVTVRSGITYGGQPIGRAVGPALEAREALMALINPSQASMSLLSKSASLAGLLLEASGIVQKGLGYEVALDSLMKGKPYLKMKEIIEAQGGNPNVKPDDLPIGTYRHVIKSETDGYVTLIDNDAIVEIARTAGAPADRGAGVLLYQKQGYKVNKGDPLLEIYAERSSKLSDAVNVAERRNPVVVEGMLLKVYPPT